MVTISVEMRFGKHICGGAETICFCYSGERANSASPPFFCSYLRKKSGIAITIRQADTCPRRGPNFNFAERRRTPTVMRWPPPPPMPPPATRGESLRPLPSFFRVCEDLKSVYVQSNRALSKRALQKIKAAFILSSIVPLFFPFLIYQP